MSISCYDVSSRVININRYCPILFFLLMKKHIIYELLKISHYFTSLFSKYSIYQDEHLEVVLSVYNKTCAKQDELIYFIYNINKIKQHLLKRYTNITYM